MAGLGGSGGMEYPVNEFDGAAKNEKLFDVLLLEHQENRESEEERKGSFKRSWNSSVTGNQTRNAEQ